MSDLADPPQRVSPAQLPRLLGGREAITLVVGTIIGSGIFFVPRTVAQETGSAGMALLVWIVVGCWRCSARAPRQRSRR